jgi:hypothetical protein
MSYRLSRLLSTATAAYGGHALAPVVDSARAGAVID